MSISIKVNKNAMLRHCTQDKTRDISAGEGLYWAKLQIEPGQTKKDFLSIITSDFRDYGLTIHQWREHGAEIKFYCFGFCYKTLGPIVPGSNRSNTDNKTKR